MAEKAQYIKTDNTKLIEVIEGRIKNFTGGHCPCVPPQDWNEDTICPCKNYREQGGKCHCGLYIK